jgi:hypothetical protein
MPIGYQSDVLSLGRDAMAFSGEVASGSPQKTPQLKESRGGMKDGRSATEPYRVRVGGIWYWVDPTVRRPDIEPGDTVLIYPTAGEPALAVLQSPLTWAEIAFSSLEGDGFALAAADIAALHLAAVDEVP